MPRESTTREAPGIAVAAATSYASTSSRPSPGGTRPSDDRSDNRAETTRRATVASALHGSASPAMSTAAGSNPAPIGLEGPSGSAGGHWWSATTTPATSAAAAIEDRTADAVAPDRCRLTAGRCGHAPSEASSEARSHAAMAAAAARSTCRASTKWSGGIHASMPPSVSRSLRSMAATSRRAERSSSRGRRPAHVASRWTSCTPLEAAHSMTSRGVWPHGASVAGTNPAKDKLRGKEGNIAELAIDPAADHSSRYVYPSRPSS
jgi:hypothetical protein